MPFVRCDEKAEYECHLRDPIRYYSLFEVPEVSLSLVMLHRSFHLFYLIELLRYWFWCSCEFDCRLHTPQRPLLVSWHKVKNLEIPPPSRSIQYVTAYSWWRALENFLLWSVANLPVLLCYLFYILDDHAVAQLVVSIAMVKFPSVLLPRF